jgi:hypothetical protein
MSRSVYDKHNTTFKRVSSFAILDETTNNLIATIALKFPVKGEGRVTAFVHHIGVPMTQGYAGGYGYDKRTAAINSAVESVHVTPNDGRYFDFINALSLDDGYDWATNLRKANFFAFQTI